MEGGGGGSGVLVVGGGGGKRSSRETAAPVRRVFSAAARTHCQYATALLVLLLAGVLTPERKFGYCGVAELPLVVVEENSAL